MAQSQVIRGPRESKSRSRLLAGVRPRLPIGMLVPVTVLSLWEWASRAGHIPAWQLPAPTDICLTLVDLVLTGELAVHVLSSLRRVFLGFLIGGGLGVVLGMSVGLSRVVDRLFNTSLQALKSVPSLGWVPLLILWFGIGETPKLTLIAIGSFFPVYVSVVAGFRGVERSLIEVGRVHHLSPLAILARIQLPAALPSCLTGLRVGLTQAWLFMVIAELMAASEGLGFLLTMGREVARADLLLSSLMVLAVLGKLTDALMGQLERWVLRWRDTVEE